MCPPARDTLGCPHTVALVSELLGLGVSFVRMCVCISLSGIGVASSVIPRVSHIYAVASPNPSNLTTSFQSFPYCEPQRTGLQLPHGGYDALPWCLCGPQRERCTAWSVPSTPCSASPVGPAGWTTADPRTGEPASPKDFVRTHCSFSWVLELSQVGEWEEVAWAVQKGSYQVA